MKKILVLILSFWMMEVVSADTYYSPYSEFGEYQEQEVVEDEYTDVQTEERYLWYQEKEIGDYFILDENDTQYLFLDENRYKDTNFTKWEDLVVPENKPSRVIEQRTIYRYQKRKKAQYLHLYNVQGENSFQLSLLEIYYRNQKIEFQVQSRDCLKCDEDSFDLKNDGELWIDLGEAYALEDLEIHMIIHDDSTVEKRYVLDVTYDSQGEEVLASRLSRLWFRGDKEITFGGNDAYLLKNPQWEESHYTTKECEESPSLKVSKVEQYRYKDRLYYYYYWKRSYQDEYQASGSEEYPLQDMESKKVFYSYRKRDKLVLVEPLVIEKEEQTLEDFIVEASGPYVIDTKQVDFDRNGTYPIVIRTDYQTLEKEVEILKNEEEVEDLEEEKISPQEKVYQENSTFSEKNDWLEEQVEELNSSLQSCQEKQEDLEAEMVTKEQPKSVRKQGGILFLIVGLFLSMSVIVIGRKMKVENKF